MESHSHGTAEAVRIETDEHGWELHILDSDGWHIWNIHGEALELLKQCRQISDWWQEGLDAAAAHIPDPTAEDLEGYELDDPKRIELQRMIDRATS